MEESKTNKLPWIFKFSVLCNILPYYGHLHKWKAILTSVNKRTKELWIQHKTALMHWGKDYKFTKFFKTFKGYSSILKNSELFNLKSKWFYNGWDSKIWKIKSSWKVKHIILPLLRNLNEDNYLILYKWEPNGENINYITEDEAAFFIPSNQCSSSATWIRLFKWNKARNICKYISEKIKYKKIIIKKIEGDSIQINSIVHYNPHESQVFNILNKFGLNKLKKLFSWPVYNWIWKPISLLCNSILNSKDRYNSFEEISEEITQEILNMTFLENLKELYIERYFKNFDSMQNLFKITEWFTNMKVNLNIWYNNSISEISG